MNRIEDYLFEASELYPQKTAVICGSCEVRYLELWKLCKNRADQLVKGGIKNGQICFFRSSQNIDFLVTYFGIHIAGAVAAPLEEDLPQERFDEMVNRYKTSILPGNIADVLFTTGTTGKAKGVKISHGTIMAEAENLAIAQGFSHDTLFVICGPLNHIGSLSKIYPVICLGGTLYITDGMKNLDNVFSALSHPNGKIGTFLVPAHIRMLLQFGKERLAALADKIDFLETGAAAINENDMQQLCRILPKSRLFNTYASTETGIISTYNFNEGDCVPGCLGRAMKNSSFFITGDGRIACKGDTIMSGYLEEEELTEEILRDGVIYTNDKGFVDKDGMLHLQGRMDDIINMGGYKINPLIVENAAMSFQGIKDCICIAASHPIVGEVLKLLVVYDAHKPFSKKELALHIKSLLVPHEVPQQYELVDKIERTFNGKPNRKFYQI